MSALPVLLRRLQDAARVYSFGVNHPIRRKRSELVEEAKLRISVQLARATPDCMGILIVLDADDDLACLIGPQLLNWARAEARGVPCEVVVANREYEAWFLASLESLRGSCGIAPTATSSARPENIRDAKGAVQAQMTPGSPYSPTAHQAALTARIELAKGAPIVLVIPQASARVHRDLRFCRNRIAGAMAPSRLDQCCVKKNKTKQLSHHCDSFVR